jgi:hypothetical protein
MAFGIVPDIKNEDVVCQKPCKHTDCAAMREDFIDNGDCVICGKPLVCGQAYCYLPEHGKYAKAHFLCLP